MFTKLCIHISDPTPQTGSKNLAYQEQSRAMPNTISLFSRHWRDQLGSVQIKLNMILFPAVSTRNRVKLLLLNYANKLPPILKIICAVIDTVGNAGH